MENNYEVIVIGSGLSGLSIAYILAKNGFKVAVLEKNAQFGGCLQSFKREGVTFETGMHYVGSIEEGQILHKYFNYLSILDDIELSSLNKSCYDIIDFRGERYSYANGHENFVETLSQKFPYNVNDIKEYVKAIHNVTENSPYYSFKNFDTLNILDPAHVKTSINGYISQITKNEALQNVLTGNIPLYAGLKDKTPLYIHALISDFYINSAYRIVGSSDNIAKSLVKSLRNIGVELFNNSEVDKIICDNKQVTAVELKNGNHINTKYLISSIHPEYLLKMIDSPLIRRAYRDRIRNMEQTVSTFTVFIKFKENTVPYLNSNFFKYRDKTIWDCETYTEESWPKSYLYMHQCSEKDQKFAKGAILFAYMNYADVMQWDGTRIGRRGADYEEFKKIKAEKLLSCLEKDMPGILSNIDNYWTSSPLTYQDYTATKEGSTYGVVRDVSSPIQTTISQRTKIPNLFLTGQNTNSHGVLGVIISSVITASELLGKEFLINQINEF
ncbi:MAG: NAD(P)/FAD-dependent oxidoreductase [Lentimicrobiaceae bacterium]|nr:NAD(P)/FAD-dependent oxidoreductase [Lentimicrobiaceae bacterium]